MCMVVDAGSKNVTTLLRAWGNGDRGAFDQLIPIVYDELHRLARRYMKGERSSHTFRPTDLVGEAYLRLVEGDQPEWKDRVHFFAVAATTMRRILVDHARLRNADKRGGGERAVTFDEGLVGGDRPAELVALDEALDVLAAFDPRSARAVELHYFGGMSHEEVAAAIGVAVRTVARDLRDGETWIRKHLRDLR